MRRAAAFPWAIAGVVACSWLVLWAWSTSAYSDYLGHGSGDGGATPVATIPLFAVGWALMIAAMMLPLAASLVGSFGLVVRRRPDRRRLEAALIAGFFSVWIAVGFAFQAFDGGVHAAVHAVSWLGDRPQLLGAAAFVAAGTFQFSSLKHRCLTACRTPRSFVYRHWRGGRPETDALRIGVAYGVSCVGCCWALMLLLFALAATSLPAMLAVGVLAAAERNTAVGARLSAPVGAGLVVAGVVMALG